jgi:hypothetical protein
MYDVAGHSPDREKTASIGTRFLVFPQPPFLPGYERPELVWLPIEPGRILAGPQSNRVYLRDPLENKDPYQAPYLPPYRGLCHPPAEPGPDGHFDHILPDSRVFLAAHTFACVHRVIDICENYLQRTWPWFFEPAFSRLEIIPNLHWTNAQSGFGFLELGEEADLPNWPFALNFDVIAHEVGHLVLFSILGMPRGQPSLDYFTYHEAVADFISLLGLLHFDTALDRILRRTRGNLLVMNELDRFAEISDERQVRRFSNSSRMQNVGLEVHDRSKPFAGALFDSIIEIYQTLLFERGLSKLNTRRFSDLRRELSEKEFDIEFRKSIYEYNLHHYANKLALIEARDIIGRCALMSWNNLNPDSFQLTEAAEAILYTAELDRASAPFVDVISDCFSWRGFS